MGGGLGIEVGLTVRSGNNIIVEKDGQLQLEDKSSVTAILQIEGGGCFFGNDSAVNGPIAIQKGAAYRPLRII